MPLRSFGRWTVHCPHGQCVPGYAGWVEEARSRLHSQAGIGLEGEACWLYSGALNLISDCVLRDRRRSVPLGESGLRHAGQLPGQAATGTWMSARLGLVTKGSDTIVVLDKEL